MNNFVVLATGSSYGVNASSNVVATLDLVHTLSKGSIAFFNQDTGVVIDEAADILASTKQIVLACRDYAMDTVRVTSPIVRKTLRAKITPYVAPAAKVMCIGTNTDAGTTYGLHIAPTILAGDEYGALVTNLALPLGHNDRERSYVYVAGYGETQETVVKAIVAKINADPKSPATASIVDVTNYNGITFTGKLIGGRYYNFAVSPLEMLRDADVLEYKNVVRTMSSGTTSGPNPALTAGLAAYVEGVGLGYQIIDELKDAWAKAGWGNSHVENIPTTNFSHNIGKLDTFNTIVLEYKPDFASGQDLGNEMHFTQTILLIVPTANSTLWTLLQAIVNAYAA